MTTKISIEDVLTTYGITDQTISQQHRDELDEQGFTIFHDVISPEWLKALQDKFENLMETEGDQAGIEVHQMPGIRRLSDLVNKGDVFDRLYVHPLVLAATYHIIQRPFKIVSLNGHDPLLGYGQQRLHSDFGGERESGTFHQINSVWMLDDLTAENGATRLVPGSHRWPTKPQDELEDLLAPHPEEVYITAPAGSMAVFNGQIWHGSTHNHNGKQRRVYHGAFCAREHKQQTDQRAYLRPETAARISPEAKYILDVL
ncbi:MAG: phytanoyl-CoA dioxygenase family protein [Chloroflexota bacterium]